MKATTEMEIKITGGRIIGADLSADGVCKLTVEAEFETEQEPKKVPSKTLDETAAVKPEKKVRDCCGYEHGYNGYGDFEEWDQTGCLG